MIGLADCNNFYVSCERLFNPKLKDNPVVVLSNNDGCIIARSDEAKKIGIKMGEPAFKIKHVIEKYNVEVFSTNFALYGDLSRRVMQTFKTEVNKMEVYSIDEAFLDFTDYSDKQRAIDIKKKVQQWTGIPISIGIAKTKTLAKMANYIAKKYTNTGVFLLDNEDLVVRALKFFPIEELWGVGRRYAKRLKGYGISTAFQFREIDANWLRRNFSINLLKTQKELNGEVCFPLEQNRKRKRNICTSRSFAKEIQELSTLRQVVSSYANSCAIKLRKEKSSCCTLGVFLITNRFKLKSKQYFPYRVFNLHVPTNDSAEIVKYALKILDQIFRPGYNYKKAGVIVSKIVPENQTQLSFFDHVNRGKRRKINSTIDVINSKMGQDKLRLAVQLSGRKWKFKKERLSPCYTTRFSDMLEVML